MTTDKPSRRPGRNQYRTNAVARFGRDKPRVPQRKALGVLHIGKIDLRFEHRHRADEPRAQGVGFPTECAPRDAQRLTSLDGGFRVDEIRESLDLGEIKLAVLERAPSEFAGVRRTKTWRFTQRRHDPRQDGASSGHVKFGHLFAGKAARGDEPNDERAIQRLSSLWIVQCPQRRDSVWKYRARRQCLQSLRAIGPRNAHHGDRRTTYP